ncbi:DUF2242 domain-containing protein [Burkholderia sp. WAC0059]|uniref:DUF2242 domain-containing protein n=1 Tax=Burkholderia sp. WAC0059 TaxID=2066022 RepID=UPI000C7F36AB|nr:DUF2242 domain-containing protein [Burkholderia sp. WAC0059]PLZ04155.1 DUF2242 domain-containing protein [Burkholderia sp. WAC0059]
MSLFPRVAPFLLVPLLAVLGACASPQPKFRDDQLLNSSASPYARNFSFSNADACDAARRALLSQGYMSTMPHDDTVDATKNFQPTNDTHYVVEVHVVCTPGDAGNTSVVYVNAIQDGYALKKSDTSASVGLSIFGSLSLPIRSNNDAMVKISSETIQSDAFYTRFFELVGQYLNTVAHPEAVPGGSIDITPLPPVAHETPPVAATAAAVPQTASTTTAIPPSPATVSATPEPTTAAANAGTAGAQPTATTVPAAVQTQPAETTGASDHATTTATSPADPELRATMPQAMMPASPAPLPAPLLAPSPTVVLTGPTAVPAGIGQPPILPVSATVGLPAAPIVAPAAPTVTAPSAAAGAATGTRSAAAAPTSSTPAANPPSGPAP